MMAISPTLITIQTSQQQNTIKPVHILLNRGDRMEINQETIYFQNDYVFVSLRSSSAVNHGSSHSSSAGKSWFAVVYLTFNQVCLAEQQQISIS
jgi:hypothetical protein